MRRPERLPFGQISAASISFLLVLAVPSGIAASYGSGSSEQWQGVDGNYPLNWNYSPQQGVDYGNVNSLQAVWTFPVPAAPENYTGAEGVMATPLIVHGIVYMVVNWHRVFALDASKGGVIWFKDLPLVKNYTAYVQPSIPGANGIPLGHYHQMMYTTSILGRPLVWMISNTYQIFALDANNGDVKVDFSPLAHDGGKVPGSYGIYDVDTPSILVDDKRGIVVFGPSVSEGESSARGFLEAWNVSTGVPDFLWRDFIVPPQDGSDPGWSLSSVQNMTGARVFDGTRAVDLKALPQAQLHQMLFGDWGNFGFDGTRSYAGAGSGWGGSWAIDEGAGVAYVGTSTATPDWNASERPGLDLWSDSVLALDLTTGKIQWGFQTMPHPLGDFDCSWNVVLANVTRGGVTSPTVFKGCKDGYIFALDAKTGSMVWFLKPPSVKYENVQVLDPTNRTQMTEYNWNGYPKTGRIIQNPSDTGALESDLAYDPTTGMLFAGVYNSPKAFQLTSVGAGGAFNTTKWEYDWGINVFSIIQQSPVNTTILGIDAVTGGVKWSHFIDGIPFRGGVTVSSGVVYVPTLDGVLTYLSEANGLMLGSKNVGGSLLTQPSVGEDSSGRVVLVLTDMGSSRWGPVFPGFVQGLETTQPPAGRPSQSNPQELYLPVSIGLVVAAAALVVWKSGKLSGRSRRK